MRDGLTLYVIRHGETDWNRVARYQGHSDVPLNERGRTQARRHAEALRGLVTDPARLAYVASPLVRARETVETLRATLELSPSGYDIDPRLREVHYGHWEGRLASDLPEVELKARASDPLGWRPRSGESYAEMRARTDAWLAEVETDTVVVTHGGPSRTLRATLLGLAPADVLSLEVPQDRLLVLRRGFQQWA
jgi:broad specificity phosphatase PhoE